MSYLASGRQFLVFLGNEKRLRIAELPIFTGPQIGIHLTHHGEAGENFTEAMNTFGRTWLRICSEL